MGVDGLIFAMVLFFYYQPNVADALMLFGMPVGRVSVGGVACIRGQSVDGSSMVCLRCE